MDFEELEPIALWMYYQRGYTTLVRSGRYFRQVLRPALSHVYFQRAMPLLMEYVRANRGAGDLPPGFGEQLAACPLTPRDLLHLDYAISFGFVESQGLDPRLLESAPVMTWPGPEGIGGVFIAADAVITMEIEGLTDEELDDEDDDTDEDGGTSSPPFDL